MNPFRILDHFIQGSVSHSWVPEDPALIRHLAMVTRIYSMMGAVINKAISSI